MATGIAERLDRYADLAVRVGANVEEGQVVFINGRIEHTPLIRALTHASYRAGARYVDVLFVDQHVRRAMVELGPDEALEHTPDWLKLRWQSMEGAANIVTTGDPDPELLSDLDGERVGRARMKALSEIARDQMMSHTVNWTGIACPNDGWAEKVFGEPDVERLWEALAFCVRLDEPDPVAAWREHMQRLESRAEQMNARRFDALRYRGPGTDLTVGLLGSAHWLSALFRTAKGREYVPNMPTEEIFTTPDWRRADGVVTSSRPLALGGDIVEELKLTVRGRSNRRGGCGPRRGARAQPARQRRACRPLR